MTLEGVSHIGIGVREVDRSVAFYCDVLGMRQAHRKMFVEHTAMLTKPGERDRDSTYLGWNDEVDPVVILSCHPSPPENVPPRLDQAGVHHVAFWVDEIDPIFERARAAGANILVEPYLGKQARRPVRTMFLEDPDGTIIQLDERPR
jgi:glyoxylase I family protein